MADDAQLFDRSPGWPLHHKRASVIGTERVVLEGDTTPDMVKGIFIVSRKPGLSLQEFSEHWFDAHGPLVAQVPGLRRYVQTHALPEAYVTRGMMGITHDGFSELWFDDPAALRSAMDSPEWAAAARTARHCSPNRWRSSPAGNACKRAGSSETLSSLKGRCGRLSYLGCVR